MIQNIDKGGSGCGAVGRAVTSDTGDPLFESSHGQFYLLSAVLKNFIEKMKINIFPIF